MPSPAFRFIHAADFHLEQPLHGLADAPKPLHDLLIEAPYQAARRVFETATLEQADFVVLSGDLLHFDYAGPRGIAFLIEQFEQLAESDINVYWVGGEVDRAGGWPTAVQLPDNVHLFRNAKVEEATCFRLDQPLAMIAGRSYRGRRRIRPADFSIDSEGLFTIGAVYGEADEEALSRKKIHYWALGGRHDRKTLFDDAGVAHYPGSPQGRSFAESGPHGCSLVDVDEHGHVRIQAVGCDVVRWQSEHFDLSQQPKSPQPETFRKLLFDRLERLTSDVAPKQWFVQCQIKAAGDLSTELRRQGMSDQILDRLRTQFQNEDAPLWTASLSWDPPEKLPRQYYKEDTLLGEFLRCIEGQQTASEPPLELESFLTESQLAGVFGEALQINSDPRSEQRSESLREATVLALDLLRPDHAVQNSGHEEATS